jgi:hypothetical protein
MDKHGVPFPCFIIISSSIWQGAQEKIKRGVPKRRLGVYSSPNLQNLGSTVELNENTYKLVALSTAHKSNAAGRTYTVDSVISKIANPGTASPEIDLQN